MKFADFIRGVEAVGEQAVSAVFADAKAAVAKVPFLPANIRADLNKLLDDAESDILDAGTLAGTIASEAAASAVDDVTTLMMNTATALSNTGGDLSKLGPAEKVVLGQTWNAMKAQGDTLYAQLMSGINPAAPKPPQ